MKQANVQKKTRQKQVYFYKLKVGEGFNNKNTDQLPFWQKEFMSGRLFFRNGQVLLFFAEKRRPSEFNRASNLCGIEISKTLDSLEIG